MGLLHSSRKTNRPTLAKAKVVLYNYFLTVFMGDGLKDKHIFIELSWVILINTHDAEGT